MKVRIWRDEWFPVYDIDKYSNAMMSGIYVVDMDEETYMVYKGLLLQFEKLQGKLEKLYNKAEVIHDVA